MLYLYRTTDGSTDNYVTWRALGGGDTAVIAANVLLFATGTGSSLFSAGYNSRFDVAGMLVGQVYAISQASGVGGLVSVMVQAGGSVVGGTAAILVGDGFASVNNAGAIDGGVILYRGNNTITNDGQITARGWAVQIGSEGGTATLNNSGTIESSGFVAGSVSMTGDGEISITNTGLIASQARGLAILSDGATDLVNAGTITGRVLLSNRDDQVRNTGVVSGGFELNGGNDTYDGNGATGARVDGGAGDDMLLGGDGGDVLTGGEGADQLDGRGGFDTASWAQAYLVGATVDLADQGRNAGAALGDVLANIERLVGSDYADVLAGADAADVLIGGQDGDRLSGRGGEDRLAGGTGDDWLDGGDGTDTLDGGEGFDRASYASAAAAVAVTLASEGWQNTRGAGRDRLVSIEALAGSGFADTLTGSDRGDRLDGGDGDDRLNGGAGDDLLEGGAGADVLIGGAGTDIASYADAAAALTLSLAVTGGQDTPEGRDTLTGIEGLIGSGFDDRLTGAASDDILQGGAGNDRLSGGAGSDTASYADARRGVIVRVGVTAAQDTKGGGTDTLLSIENLWGSGFDDVLTGDGGNNVLRGGAGSDRLVGGGGRDTASYADAAVGVTVSLANTAAQDTRWGTDTLVSIENLTGSAFNDVLGGDADANVIAGGGGQDVLMGEGGNDRIAVLAGSSDIRGGDGIDTLDYSGLSAGVNVSLVAGGTGLAMKGSAVFDEITGIEAVIGSAFDDRFAVRSGVTVRGGAGADSFGFTAGTAAGNVVLDFSGAQGDGDRITLAGFGAGATFTQVDATHWVATGNGFSEVITFAGAPTIDVATDVAFLS